MARDYDAQPRVQPDPPVRAFYLASAGGGGPVNLVLLGRTMSEVSTTVLMFLPIILAAAAALVFWRNIAHPILFCVTSVLALIGVQSLIAPAVVMALLSRNANAISSEAFEHSVIASAILVVIVGVPFLWWLRRAFFKATV